jgi:hypothetical protein
MEETKIRQEYSPTQPRTEKFLKDAFASEQICLTASLRSSSRISHAGNKGEVNEQFFIQYLRKYLPNRYTVEKAMVLDYRGSVSDSIDIVVFDRQYTPTLLDTDKHRYVPAESVYAIFVCKPKTYKGTIYNQEIELVFGQYNWFRSCCKRLAETRYKQ